MSNNLVYTEEDSIVTEYVINIIEEAMKRYNLSFDKTVECLDKLRYWELFNNTDITLVGAHDGIEPVLKDIKELIM